MSIGGKRKRRSERKELLLLLLLRLEGPIGRYALKHMLGMAEHEGRVRQMLADLQEDGYVSASRRGSKLTVKGEEHLNQQLKTYNIADIKEVAIPPLEMGAVSIGIHLKGKASAIRSGMKQRDAAVRGGASGATILTFKEGVLSIPTVYRNLSSEHLNLVTQIHRSFSLTEADVLIITSAQDLGKALEGALATALC